MPSARQSPGDQTRLVTATVLLLLGVGLVAHPVYLWPHYGEESTPLFAEPVSEPPDEYVEFESLPSEARPAVRAAIEEGQVTVWSGEDAAAYDALTGMGLLGDTVTVRYRASYYRVGMYYTTNSDFFGPLLRWLLTAGAAFLIVYGAMLFVGESWRPFTPRRSLWLPASVAVAVYATNAYDVTVGGVRGSVTSLSPRVVLFVPLASLLFVIGAEVATNGPTSRRMKAAGIGAGIVAIGLLLIIHPVALATMLVIMAVLGLPWVALGRTLTSPA